LETLILLSIFCILNLVTTLFLLHKNKVDAEQAKVEVLNKHMQLHSARFGVLSDNIEMLETRIIYMEKIIEILYANGGSLGGTMH